MHLITINDLLENVPARYLNQYKTNRKLWDGRFTDDIYRQLIDASPLTVEKANEIVGNRSWTTITCTTCEKSVNEAIVITMPEDTAYLCKDCVQKSLTLFE